MSGLVSGQRRGREELLGAYSSDQEVVADDPLGSLASNIPGVPGEDYPVFAEVPETSFLCDGQVNGGVFNTLSFSSPF